MSTQVQRAVQFANPVSGEVLTLDSPTEDLSSYLADLREFESVLREHKQMVNRELLARMDRGAKWTVRAGEWKLSAPSPEPGEEWDGAALRESLLLLVDEGALTIEAVDAAVEVVVDYKVRKAGVNALRKLGPEVQAILEQHRTEVERARYVKVSRS